MEPLTLDQIQLFLAVVDEGSFATAARKLRRAPSAVTYGIQKLEQQIDVTLFDRAAYRASLTEAGRALVVRARRIVDETNAFRESARSLVSGLEAEITLVTDSMFPMGFVASALGALRARFPSVPPRVYVVPLGAAAQLVLDGTCMIGLMQSLFVDKVAMKQFHLLSVDLVTVVSPAHPLARFEAPIETRDLSKHVQLVLTDRSAMTAGRDYGVLSSQTWRLADLGAKHSMLLAGLGWGNMPAPLVADDLSAGRLKVIRPAEHIGRVARLEMGCAHRSDRRLGPAGRWMIDHLSTLAAS